MGSAVACSLEACVKRTKQFKQNIEPRPDIGRPAGKSERKEIQNRMRTLLTGVLDHGAVECR